MDWIKLCGEGLGLVAILVGFCLFQQKSRQKILLFKLISDIFWSAHFLMLGAYTGMAISCVAILRELIFYRLDKKNPTKRPIFWLFLFVAINVISVALTWNSIWSICSLISGILSTTAFWQNSPRRTKQISLCVCLSQLTYAFAMRSYSAILNEGITVSSIMLFFLRNKRQKKQERQEKIHQ